MERAGQDLIEFAKQTFQATLDAASKVQQQTHRFMEDLIRQGATAQGEGKRLLSDWVDQSRRHMEEFQKAASEGYRKWEEEITKRLSAVAPATKQEVQELRRRLDELASKIEALERR
ncbi:MAG: phasin family protein [Candidatus Methylomirabilaceae bacterium]